MQHKHQRSDMNRLHPRELSYARLYQAVLRRVLELPHFLAWYLPSTFSRQNRDRLLTYVNLHEGQRCFIMGNGPSLNKMDLAPLKGEITFGLNRIYLLFDRLPFSPNYYVCVNELVLEQFSREISALPMPKFLNWNRRHLFDFSNPTVSFIKLSLALNDYFALDIRRPLCSGGTVTYVALQIAFIMGFTEVILIGVDHSFVQKGTPNTVEVRRLEADPNHFHPDYFPKGTKWQFPDLRRAELAYALAKSMYERHGRIVRDATLNGKCPVFEHVAFSSLF